MATPSHGWEQLRLSDAKNSRTLVTDDGNVAVTVKYRTAGRSAGSVHVKIRQKIDGRWLHTRLVRDAKGNGVCETFGKTANAAWLATAKILRLKGLVSPENVGTKTK